MYPRAISKGVMAATYSLHPGHAGAPLPFNKSRGFHRVGEYAERLLTTVVRLDAERPMVGQEAPQVWPAMTGTMRGASVLIAPISLQNICKPADTD
jgi:hypothetical protein